MLSDIVQRLCRAPGIQFSSLVCSKVKIVVGVLGWVRCQKAKREWQHGAPWEAEGHGELVQVGSSWAVVSHSSPHFEVIFPVLPILQQHCCLCGWVVSQTKELKTSLFLLVQVFFTRSVCGGCQRADAGTRKGVGVCGRTWVYQTNI